MKLIAKMEWKREKETLLRNIKLLKRKIYFHGVCSSHVFFVIGKRLWFLVWTWWKWFLKLEFILNEWFEFMSFSSIWTIKIDDTSWFFLFQRSRFKIIRDGNNFLQSKIKSKKTKFKSIKLTGLKINCLQVEKYHTKAVDNEKGLKKTFKKLGFDGYIRLRSLCYSTCRPPHEMTSAPCSVRKNHQGRHFDSFMFSPSSDLWI